MRELVQKLFQEGKMVTPPALELIRQHGVSVEDLLKCGSDVIGPETVMGLVKKPKGISAPKSPAPSQVEVQRDRKKKIAEEYSVDFSIENNRVNPRERKAADFTNYFNSRFALLQGLLAKRLSPVSIGNLLKLNSDNINVIGMVSDIRTTNNGNKLISLEDPTGTIACIASKNVNEAVFEESNNILMDEVIGMTGSCRNGLFLIKDIVRPDVPITNLTRKLDVPLKAVFISDIHFGSKDFLEAPFLNFIKWLNSPSAEAVKYIFVAGDLCDGIGIYLAQEQELLIKEGEKQYAALAEHLEKIPKHIKLIVGPGNHDIVGNHEPQQTLDFTALSKLPNVIFATNPSTAVLDKAFRILMYHGYSYDSVIAELPCIRHDGYDKPHLPMLEVLKRRHLSPAYGGSLVIPEQRDSLVIDKVPDVFHSGHLHTVGLENYRGVTLINSGTFQGRTGFQ
ncbi:MAG: metallophosphoesterase, partial [Candidatus Aenigmarchaeota archaeon]|nr:metallophosphoesterase [Candidatus Aenigmarchaeota archaeon]